MWPGLLGDTIFCDLRSRSRSLSLTEILAQLGFFFRHHHHYRYESCHSDSLWQSLSWHARKVTFTQGQRQLRVVLGGLQQLHFFGHYHHCSLESLPDGIPWQELSKHTNLGDLYPRSRSFGLVEIFKTPLMEFTKTLRQSCYICVGDLQQGQGHDLQSRSRS